MAPIKGVGMEDSSNGYLTEPEQVCPEAQVKNFVEAKIYGLQSHAAATPVLTTLFHLRKELLTSDTVFQYTGIHALEKTQA